MGIISLSLVHCASYLVPHTSYRIKTPGKVPQGLNPAPAPARSFRLPRSSSQGPDPTPARNADPARSFRRPRSSSRGPNPAPARSFLRPRSSSRGPHPAPARSTAPACSTCSSRLPSRRISHRRRRCRSGDRSEKSLKVDYLGNEASNREKELNL